MKKIVFIACPLIIAIVLFFVVKRFMPILVINPAAKSPADFNSLAICIRTYRALNGFSPTTEQGIKALVVRPTTNPSPKNWAQLISEIPLDGWGTPYVYRNLVPNDPNGYELRSF